MPKIKTNRSAAKRFKVTGTGKLKRNKAYKSHILTKKSTKRKRNLRQSTITDATNVKNMKKITPYLHQDDLKMLFTGLINVDVLKQEELKWLELKAE